MILVGGIFVRPCLNYYLYASSTRRVTPRFPPLNKSSIGQGYLIPHTRFILARKGLFEKGALTLSPSIMEFREFFDNPQWMKTGETLGGWPWLQYRGFLPLHKRPPPTPPDKNQFEHMDFDEEESGSDYEPSAEESPGGQNSEGGDSSESEDSEELETLIKEDEVKVMVDDMEGWKFHEWNKQQVFDRAVAELEAVEKLAPTIYNVDEVVSLVSEFYELMVEMGHWPEGSICYPPHSIDLKLGKEVGYNDEVLDLMQKLPYLKRLRYGRKQICEDTEFANYTIDEDLRDGRRHYYFRDDEPCMESHMLMIASPSHLCGRFILLDTKLGKLVSSWSSRNHC